jgi:hypothetical protein
MRRVLWTLILAPPLMAWLVLAVLTLSHVPHTVHTGDAFIDAFARVFVDQGGLKYYERSSEKHLRAKEQWRPLEQQFGDDPRFWWLCYKLRNDSTVADEPPRESYLQQARQRGIANLPILLVLYTSTNSSFESRIKYEPNFNTVRGNNSRSTSLPNPGEYSKIFHARQKAIAQLHDDSIDILLKEMQARVPRHPLPYYLQAMLAGERRQYDTAYKLLKQGNCIATQEWHNGSALKDTYTPLLTKQLKTHDAPLAKSISNYSGMDYKGLSAQLQWDAEGLSYDALQMQRLDIVDEIYKMSCYIGISTGYDWGPTKLGLQACLHVQKEAAKQPAIVADHEKAAALAKLYNELCSVYNCAFYKGLRNKQLSPSQMQLLKYKCSYDFQLESLIDITSNRYYEPANLALGNNLIPVLQPYWFITPSPDEYQAEMDKLFTELLRFDYTTCSFHDPPAPPAR